MFFVSPANQLVSIIEILIIYYTQLQWKIIKYCIVTYPVWMKTFIKKYNIYVHTIIKHLLKIFVKYHLFLND